MMKKVFEGICDVCRLIDGNKELKQVYHCDMCNANIYVTDAIHDLRQKAFLAIISKFK